MSYQVEISQGASKQLNKLPPKLQECIHAKIDDLATDPRANGVKKLKNRDNGYRIRVGDYRIIYDILDEILLIIIIEVGHRSSIYKDKK
ncbi:type II toxin-antitoxin system RelE/ParE family toxin [Nostoc sp. CHAB 5836]|uniref:type II toxin-antitoxin system RelE family toxin n=1 Tax=Nostoc sp. CHAB 5836 TaxID=2780404 RepID=UPI001E35459D|nr:type II toxin-antitoxin system RelE/ParE family toxin [Nostoc sp. CHAB 5836]MCC5615198.1 type II toxin-antitoxin system RelE/ParE family toxin [Nostoc sp. CHAB 5836]